MPQICTSVLESKLFQTHYSHCSIKLPQMQDLFRKKATPLKEKNCLLGPVSSVQGSGTPLGALTFITTI